MRDIILLPGIYGSGDTHWQTYWEKTEPRMRRFQPSDWDRPDLADWTAALNTAIDRCSRAPLLVAHSLACLLVPHWAKTADKAVAGAILVCPPDPLSAAFPAEAAGFANAPSAPLPFPSLIIASTNDPFSSIDYSRGRAAAWGSDFIEAGALGHINEASALSIWPEGRAMLADFERQLV